jgi:hypothetical protein
MKERKRKAVRSEERNTDVVKQGSEKESEYIFKNNELRATCGESVAYCSLDSSDVILLRGAELSHLLSAVGWRGHSYPQ